MYKAYLFMKRYIVTLISYRIALALSIIGGFVGLLQFSFMGTFLQDGNSFPALQQYGGNLLAYLIIGTAFTSFVGVSLNSFKNTIRSEQEMGTLEFLLLSGTKPEATLVYSSLVGFFEALVNVTLLLLVVVFVFNISLHVNVLGAIVTLILTICSLSGIGLLSAGIIIVTKVGDPVTWAFTSLTGLLSGVLFPVAYLPDSLRAISAILPTTYALDALRLTLMRNASCSDIVPQLLLLAVMTMVTVPGGVLAVRAGFNRARRVGSVSHY